MDSSYAIQIEGLKKSFGDVNAVNGISLSVETGTVAAILGPNGAGKTTTINALTTQLLPDAGSLRVLGYDVVQDAQQVRRSVGITFQETSVDQALTGEQVLRFSGELYGMKKRDRVRRAAELLDMIGLTDAAKRKTKTYSGGMKRRLELARSLMNTPQLLVLDEPTLGLDPQTRTAVWDYIRTQKSAHGMTILLTTHYMDEAEELADFVYIIDQGLIVKEGNPQDLIRDLGEDRVHIHGTGDTDKLENTLQDKKYVQTLTTSKGESILIGVDSGQKRVPEIMAIASDCGFAVHEVEINQPNLGDVFFSVTGREIRE